MDRAVVETTPTSCWFSISFLNTVVVIINTINIIITSIIIISIIDIITNLRSLVSAHCSPNPTYAVFTKQHTNMPLAMKVDNFGTFFAQFNADWTLHNASI